MMEKDDDSYSVVQHGSFAGLDYSIDAHHHHHESFLEGDTSSPADYMFHNPHPPPQTATSFDRLSFADVMQFADFGPKLALNQPRVSDDYNSMDPIYFLKFPVLNDRSPPEQSLLSLPEPPSELAMPPVQEDERFSEAIIDGSKEAMVQGEEEEEGNRENTAMKLRLLGSIHNTGGSSEGKNRRKRPRSVKTSEEVESQRMTHIAVERNRRKQMNEHLRVLRALMPSSYVQRGDQASIIGGAIEFVRELEQLLQCLESQKRRRLYGSEACPRPMGESPPMAIQPSQTPFLPSMPQPNDQSKLLNFDGGLQEETAEIRSCLADIEVKLLGFDALIKILSRRRPGQLLKTIAALEDLQLSILHTNITTIEQTVLYSFNVKVTGESRFTAEDIANSVQQIFNFIHASTI